MSKLKYKPHDFLTKILNLKIFVLFSNLLVQGIRYMSIGEKIYKISITIILTFCINPFIDNIYLSLLFSHFLNYIFNGQFYVLYRYLSSKRTMSYQDLENFILLIKKLINIFSPKDVLIIGSFSRGKMSKNSDLDIRLFHSGNFFQSLKAYLMATILRTCGLFMRFPIDIFCFSEISFLKKIDPSEIPVNFLKSPEITNIYPKSKHYENQLESIEIT